MTPVTSSHVRLPVKDTGGRVIPPHAVDVGRTAQKFIEGKRQQGAFVKARDWADKAKMVLRRLL